MTQALAQFERTSGTAALRDPLLRVLRSAATLPALNARIANLVFAISVGDGVPTADALANAQRSRDAANAAVTAARTKLDTLRAGATSTDLQNGRNSVESARAALATAIAKRDQVRAGASSNDVQNARNTVGSAEAALQTALARSNQVLGGPLPVDVAVQQQALQQAEASLRKAEDDLAGAVLLAPFAGVVGAITMNVGEASGTGAIVLIDPGSMQLNATAQESEVGRLKVGQNVNLTFDAYAGATVPGRVASVAPAADVVQGVPSYAVVIEVVRGQGARSAANVDLRSGMAGTAAVELARYDDVLTVPSRAVRRQGRNQTVEVMVDGRAEQRTVRTGATDGQFTQILEGLNEGDVVVIPTTTTTTTTGASQQQQFQGPQGQQSFIVPGGAGGR
jgi:HlyD family secretion protein